MRSFVSVLISVALASLISAAPLHGNHPASVPNIPDPSKLSSVLQSSSNPAVGGQLGSVEGEVKNVAHVRNFKSQIKGAVDSIESKLNARANTSSSMAAILGNLTAEVQSCTEELNFLNPLNLTVTLVEDTFSSIETLINEAIAQLETLAGEDLSVILAAIDDDGNVLTLSRVSNNVAKFLYMIFAAAQNVLKVADTQDSNKDVTRRILNSPIETDVGILINNVLPSFTRTVDTLVPGLDVTSLLNALSPLVSSALTPLATINRRV